MKKQYITPDVLSTDLHLSTIVCGSGVNSQGANVDVRHGGVDTNGSKDPDANRRNDSNVEWGNLW